MAGESKRDPLAIAIALVGLAVQVGLGLYWGGKLEARVAAAEQGVQRVETRQTETDKTVAAQSSSIAVTTAQYTEVIRRLDSIDRKLEPRP
jgi:N-methylhydantoinase B/oxoprolinase/acetone carboxylase alpha subunit